MSELELMGAIIGLLTAIFAWFARTTTKVIDRALRAFDAMGKTMESIRLTLVSFESRLARVEEKLEESDEDRGKRK